MNKEEIIAEIAEILEDPDSYVEAIKDDPDRYADGEHMVRVWVSVDAIKAAREIIYPKNTYEVEWDERSKTVYVKASNEDEVQEGMDVSLWIPGPSFSNH